ncbi:hypothetical protein ACFVYJ_03590 [Pontibacter sp. JAM-7]|uniref:hypothetical protein n=1 Tax=Pontibacter sp. JAM-7 TaxID=3366581 RepID=UPI003AF8534A
MDRVMSDQEKPLSTSALARALDKTTRQMFAELEALGWIKRFDDNWQLTTKGEFEGGSYRDSDKFGRYIIWPESVRRHAALLAADAGLLRAGQLAQKLDMPVRQLRLLMQALGWHEAARRGWVLTDKGEAQGGCQRENLQTGVPFVLWPQVIAESAILQAACTKLQALTADADDQFACLDGHRVIDAGLKQVDDWLFLAGLRHAVDWQLPVVDECLRANFYLPDRGVYLEYWQPDADPTTLKAMMRRREVYRLHQLDYIELQPEALAQLDDTLRRELLRFGIETL